MHRVKINIIRAAYAILTHLHKTTPPFVTTLNELKYINAGAVHSLNCHHGYYLFKHKGNAERWMLIEHQGKEHSEQGGVHIILLRNLKTRKALIILDQIREHMKNRCQGFRNKCWFDDAVNSGENSLTSVQARLALGETFDLPGPRVPKQRIKRKEEMKPSLR